MRYASSIRCGARTRYPRMDDLGFTIPSTKRKKRGRYARRGPVPQTVPTLARILYAEKLGYNQTRERAKLGIPLEETDGDT